MAFLETALERATAVYANISTFVVLGGTFGLWSVHNAFGLRQLMRRRDFTRAIFGSYFPRLKSEKFIRLESLSAPGMSRQVRPLWVGSEMVMRWCFIQSTGRSLG